MAGEFIPPPVRNGGAGSAGAGEVQAPDYRQLQHPEEVDVRHLDMAATEAGDAAAMRARALGSVFTEFGKISTGISTKLATKAGQQAGAADALKPGFQPKSGLASITAYGSAYDAAAHVSYVNSTNAHLEDALTQAEQANEGNPVGFATQAKAIGDAILKQTPALYQPEMQNSIALRTHAGMARTQQQAIVTARSDAFESYTSTTDSRIDSSLKTAATLPSAQQAGLVQKTVADNRAQLDALVQARAITPEHSAVLQKQFEAQMTKAVHEQYKTNIVDHLMSAARGGDVEASDRAMHQYIADPRNSAEDKAEIAKAYVAQLDTFHQVQSRVYANDIAAVGQRLVERVVAGQLIHGASGKAVEPQIHQLYKVGALSPEGLHSFMDESMRNQLAGILDSSTNQLVDAAVHGTGPKLDPANHEVVKAADTYFRTHIGISGVLPLSDQWTNGAATFASETNIIPPTVQSQIRIGLISGDPAMAVRAAASAERIRAANPQIDPYSNDPRTAAIAASITANLHANIPPQRAYEMAVQAADRPKDEKELLAKNYAQALRDKPNGQTNAQALQVALNAATPGIFANAPVAPNAMQAEYGRAVAVYYSLNGGNMAAARTLAAKQVQATWSVSRANGAPELMKYAPERLGIAPDILRPDIASVAKASGYTGDPAQVRLTPNQWTDNSQGRIWNLTHTDSESGMTDVLLDAKNQPLVYHVPLGEDFAKARQALVAQKIAAARTEREADRKNSAEQIMFEQQLADKYLNGNAAQRMMAGR